MSDKEAQADEVLALASIYESSMFSANENAGLYSGQFKVFPQLPQPFYVMKDLNDEEKSRHQVEHLPPITLHFELPSNYPSTSPPAFTLACKWLNRKQLSELCEKLDKICLENKGDVVLFQWFNFLNEESLSTLSIGGSLNLCEAVLKTKCKKQNSVEKIEDKKNKLTDEKNIFKINDQTAQCEDVEKPASTGCAERNISVSTLSHFKANPMKKENKRNKFFGRNANNKEQWKNQFYKTNRTSHSFSKRHWQKSRGGNPLSIERQRTRLEQEPSKSTGATNLDENCKYDERAVQETVSETELLTVILEYNKLRQQQVFDQSFFTCKICFEEKLGSQCKAFRPCNHVFCKGCLKSYFELQISSGSVNRLNCAEDKCNSQALPSMVKESVEQSPCLLKMSTNKKQMESRTILKEICYIQIRELVEPELYLKYDRLLLTTTLDTMSDIIYCPRRSCHCPVLVEPDSNMASCPSCFLVFCVYCNMTYHGVVPCKLRPDEQRKIVQDYINGDENGKKLLEQRYGRQQVQQLVDNVLSEKWIKVNSKPCPNCNAHIEKLDGCNKMTCWRCDTYFCWLCLARLTKGNPYLHYNDLKSSCNGKLFQGINENDDNDDDDDEDDDENWELGQFL